MSDLQCATTMVLARHGEAEYESEQWSDAGGSLTRVGRRQAAALAESLRERRVAHVWTSTMARAVQTGEIVAAALGTGVTTRDGLREFATGDFNGTPYDAGDPFLPTYHRWLDGDLDHRLPGGETGREVVARVGSVLREVSDLHRGETVLVVGHGGALRLSIPMLAAMNGAASGALSNCQTVEVAADADGWVCRGW